MDIQVYFLGFSCLLLYCHLASRLLNLAMIGSLHIGDTITKTQPRNPSMVSLTMISRIMVSLTIVSLTMVGLTMVGLSMVGLTIVGLTMVSLTMVGLTMVSVTMVSLTICCGMLFGDTSHLMYTWHITENITSGTKDLCNCLLVFSTRDIDARVNLKKRKFFSYFIR